MVGERIQKYCICNSKKVSSLSHYPISSADRNTSPVNSSYRTWEICTLAFPCPVNRVIHDSIACYAHFHNACLLVFIKMSILVIKKSPAYYHIQSHSNLFTLYIERFLSAKFILQNDTRFFCKIAFSPGKFRLFFLWQTIE